MSSPPGRGTKPRHRRSPEKQSAPIVSPKQVIARAQALPQAPTSAEEPLTAKEIAQLKLHFKFLREHRNVLKLRVNAAEDLLLNGVKEPTHRGVCQHLLAKVERSRVLTVSQTLPPAEAVRLLGGVLRFAPDIAFLLRYLECVKQTASQKQAGAALTEVLERIDYSQLSAAQMRQLVGLIVDVFAERDLPVFVFTLLYDRAFREALDRSLEGFPEVLSRMMRPLRSLHEIVAQAARRHEPTPAVSELKQAMDLLLDVEPSSLTHLPESARRRLFLLATDMLRANQALPSGALEAILSTLGFPDPTQKASATLSLAGALLTSGQQAAAKKLLEQERRAGSSSAELVRWCDALDAQHIGEVALESSRSRDERPASGRWFRGWHLRTQSVVLVRCGNPGERALYAEQIDLWRNLLVPAVSRVVATSAESPTPYLAVQLPGTPLTREIKGNGRVPERLRKGWAIELCSILSALAGFGVLLTDAELRRFNLVGDGQLFLVDLWPLRKADPQVALSEHLDLAKRGAIQLTQASPCYGFGDNASARMQAARDMAELVRTLEGA